ncbi:hypothetical protein CFC21_100214 [Triticum aestivum]|uniref:F-box domain-containing protein n=2 Tax=Triticum aestivum TaxID=4565 RepID=A0A9R1M0J7_WHEAT|nr:hypothetical protein CFC21_100214 [Triticum aestivum]
MPDWRGDTQLGDLPKELIDSILVLLPSKDAGRCRAVSKSWRSITSRSEFMLEHHRRQPSLPIINGQGWPSSFVLFRQAGTSSSNQKLWPFNPGTRFDSDSCLQGTCDGLIIVNWGSRLYVCNPVIRKHILLPQPQAGQAYNRVSGFYQHHLTGEHRVLLVSTPCQGKSNLYVITVGSMEPRHVTVKMPVVLSSYVEHRFLVRLLPGSYCPPPVQHRGSLHWCPPCGAGDIPRGIGDIIVFDTEAESFRWMHTPAQPYSDKKLFEMKGELAFWGGRYSSSNIGLTVIDVWVMQDYKVGIWGFQYRIDLSTLEASRQLYLSSYKKKKKTPLRQALQWFNDVVLLNEHELLIRFNSEHVVRCDTDGKFLGMVNIGKSQYRMMLTQYYLSESIIPIPSNDMQEDDEVPPFIGHI